MLRYAAIESPIGRLHAVDRDGRLCTLAFDDDRWAEVRAALVARSGVAMVDGQVAAAPAIEAYFAGDLHAIDRIEVEMEGTEFQRRVWNQLRRIPCGQTTTYGAIAAALGQPTATRAVGAANGQNPVAVVVPCHRVIGRDGTLTGYGGGLPRKRALLELEGAIARELFARS